MSNTPNAETEELDGNVDEIIEEIERLRTEVPYPQLNPALVPVQIDENTIHIRGGPWSGPILTITDKEEEAMVSELISSIDGHTHIDDITAEYTGEDQREIIKMLVTLYEKKAIHDVSAYEADDLHHHTALQPFKPREEIDEHGIERLEQQSLLLIAGSNMASMIASDMITLGVGEVTAYRPEGITAPEFNNVAHEDAFSIHESTELDEAIMAADFVVYTADSANPPLEKKIDKLTRDQNTPWMPVRQLGYDGIIGPTIFPNETAGWQSFQHRVNCTVPSPEYYNEFRSQSRDVDRRHPAFSRMLAGFVAMDLEHLLLSGIGFTSGRVITVNSIDLTMHADRVLKVPRSNTTEQEPGDAKAPLLTLQHFVENTEG